MSQPTLIPASSITSSNISRPPSPHNIPRPHLDVSILAPSSWAPSASAFSFSVAGLRGVIIDDDDPANQQEATFSFANALANKRRGWIGQHLQQTHVNITPNTPTPNSAVPSPSLPQRRTYNPINDISSASASSHSLSSSPTASLPSAPDLVSPPHSFDGLSAEDWIPLVVADDHEHDDQQHSAHSQFTSSTPPTPTSSSPSNLDLWRSFLSRYHELPLELVRADPTFRSLFLRPFTTPIPSAIRAQVWKVLSGSLELRKAHFATVSATATVPTSSPNDLSTSTPLSHNHNDHTHLRNYSLYYSHLLTEHSKNGSSYDEEIQRDLQRTMPGLALFRTKAQQREQEEEEQEQENKIQSDVEQSKNDVIDSPLISSDSSNLSNSDNPNPPTDSPHEPFGGLSLLKRILCAYAVRHPLLGYCQGLNLLAAMIIAIVFRDDSNEASQTTQQQHHQSQPYSGFFSVPSSPHQLEEDCFWMFCALVESRLGYYVKSMCGLEVDNRVLSSLCSSFLPRLSQHLERNRISLTAIAVPWLVCWFVEAPFEIKETGKVPINNHMSLERIALIWDAIMLSGTGNQSNKQSSSSLMFGDEVFFGLSLALLSTREAHILTLGEEDTSSLLENLLPASWRTPAAQSQLDSRVLLQVAEGRFGPSRNLTKHIATLRTFHKEQVLKESHVLHRSQANKLAKAFMIAQTTTIPNDGNQNNNTSLTTNTSMSAEEIQKLWGERFLQADGWSILISGALAPPLSWCTTTAASNLLIASSSSKKKSSHLAHLHPTDPTTLSHFVSIFLIHSFNLSELQQWGGRIFTSGFAERLMRAVAGFTALPNAPAASPRQGGGKPTSASFGDGRVVAVGFESFLAATHAFTFIDLNDLTPSQHLHPISSPLLSSFSTSSPPPSAAAFAHDQRQRLCFRYFDLDNDQRVSPREMLDGLRAIHSLYHGCVMGEEVAPMENEDNQDENEEYEVVSASTPSSSSYLHSFSSLPSLVLSLFRLASSLHLQSMLLAASRTSAGLSDPRQLPSTNLVLKTLWYSGLDPTLFGAVIHTHRLTRGIFRLTLPPHTNQQQMDNMMEMAANTHPINIGTTSNSLSHRQTTQVQPTLPHEQQHSTGRTGSDGSATATAMSGHESSASSSVTPSSSSPVLTSSSTAQPQQLPPSAPGRMRLGSLSNQQRASFPVFQPLFPSVFASTHGANATNHNNNNNSISNSNSHAIPIRSYRRRMSGGGGMNSFAAHLSATARQTSNTYTHQTYSTDASNVNQQPHSGVAFSQKQE